MDERQVQTIGASLIVRDEAAVLGRCLAALAGLVDEMVVYDTGSADGTREIARAAGALVVAGHWDDDFARARNDALALAGTTWVLAVDADELVRADPAAFRALLADGPPRDGYTVEIHNLGSADDALGYSHHAARLFRRGDVRWAGRVHEKLVATDGSPLPLAPLPSRLLRIEHRGYADPATVRSKAERNAALVRVELDELVAAGDPAAVPGRLVDLGRSLVSTGALQEAVDVLEAARELAPGTRDWRQATDFLTRVLLAAGQDDVVLVLCDQLQQAGADRRYCNWLRAQALAQLGEVGAALELLRGIDRLVDPGDRDHDLGKVLEVRSLVAQLAGQTEEALVCLVAAMAGHGRVDGRGGSLLQLWGSRSAAELAAQLSRAGADYRQVLQRELRGQGEAGAAVADALRAC